MKKISGPRIRVLSELPTNIDTASRNPHWVPNSHLFKSFPQFCRPFPSMFPNSWLLSSLPFPTPLTLAQKKKKQFLPSYSIINPFPTNMLKFSSLFFLHIVVWIHCTCLEFLPSPLFFKSLLPFFVENWWKLHELLVVRGESFQS